MLLVGTGVGVGGLGCSLDPHAPCLSHWPLTDLEQEGRGPEETVCRATEAQDGTCCLERADVPGIEPSTLQLCHLPLRPCFRQTGLRGSSLLIREIRTNPLLEEKIPAHLSLSITENGKSSPGFEAHMLCIPNDSSSMPQKAPSTNKCGPSVPGAARPEQRHVFEH